MKQRIYLWCSCLQCKIWTLKKECSIRNNRNIRRRNKQILKIWDYDNIIIEKSVWYTWLSDYY